MTRQTFTGAAIFDGTELHHGKALVVEDGHVLGITEKAEGDLIRLHGGTLAPGFIDLQVNGGAGVMIDGTTDVARIATICDIHGRLGATGILPTLITDRPEATAQVIAAGLAAARAQVPGFLGLHLEGPHLDPRRQGAHDPVLIRPMSDEDCARLCAAAAALPVLMITLAPAAVTSDQITRLAAAGALVSLGHTDCTLAEAMTARQAGASCITHLFNAMSQLGNREPGLIGAALTSDMRAGLIADGIHVHPATLRIALAVKDNDQMFLVSDAMAAAGSDLAAFELGGRHILRQNGRLTLEDGTLAGADLSLAEAVNVMITQVGTAPASALRMSSTTAARFAGLSDRGHLQSGARADLVHLRDDWTLAQVWRGGAALPPLQRG